jgi:hypothetical protein
VRRVAAFVCLREIPFDLRSFGRNGESTERGTISESGVRFLGECGMQERTIYRHDGYADNVFGVFSKTIEKGDPKEWLLGIHTPVPAFTLLWEAFGRSLGGGGCIFGNGATRRSLGGQN